MPGNAPVVLLLEDEPLIAMDTEFTLAEAGFDVTTLASCEEALEWLAVCRPDLVIVDVVLRDGSCHAVVEQLIADGVPFVVHSGDFPDAHADTILSKGYWMAKPSDSVEMIRIARKLAAA